MRLWSLLLFSLFIPSSSLQCYDVRSFECWPIEIQEMVLMVSGQDTLRYNCSGRSVEEWYEIGTKRVGWGVYYISAGIFFQLIGWPVLWIFLTKFNMTHALKVYRVMVFIGLIEISEVWGNSVWPGVVALFGEVYCTSPRITTIVGKVTMVQWALGSSSAIFLGLHRLTDMAHIGEWLVNTNLKTSFWLLLLTAYAFYGSIFFDTILFNSAYMAPIFNPMIGTEGITYDNKFLYCHNIIVSILLIAVYSSLCFIWRSRSMHTSSLHVTKFQRSILYQSVCISLTYAIPALSFVTMFLFTTPPWFFHASDITYQLSGGLPFIMYIWLNQKVQDEFLNMFGICPSKRQKSVAPTGNSNANSAMSYYSGAARAQQ